MNHQLIKKFPLKNQGEFFLTLKTINMKFVEYNQYVKGVKWFK